MMTACTGAQLSNRDARGWRNCTGKCGQGWSEASSHIGFPATRQTWSLILCDSVDNATKSLCVKKHLKLQQTMLFKQKNQSVVMGLRKGPPEKGLGPSLTQTHSPWHRWRSVHSEASLTSKGMWAMGTQSLAFDSVSAPTIAVQRGLQRTPKRPTPGSVC